jgi:hypothetical protein
MSINLGASITFCGHNWREMYKIGSWDQAKKHTPTSPTHKWWIQGFAIPVKYQKDYEY